VPLFAHVLGSPSEAAAAAPPPQGEAPAGLAAAAASLAAWADDEPEALPEHAEDLPPELRDDPLRADLRRWFGHDDFRPGQREVIEALLEGRDALAVLPTGGGKSLTYLLPGLRRPGLCLVISPLISLMQDQVQKLVARGLPAALLNSQLSSAEQSRVLERVQRGKIKILFVAPERFKSPRFVRTLQKVEVGLFAVDEAHCISQWGHDFRPDYRRLDQGIALCGRPPVVAVTATATAQVRDDIASLLDLGPDRLVLVRGFDRPNLHLSVQRLFGGRALKERALIGLLDRAPPGPGLIYCSTRKSTERVARVLTGAKFVGVEVYHAGLSARKRERVQKALFSGKAQTVVATNAFGLGIDKQDLRFVIHYDVPGTVEAYYQQAGRAGRDGEPAVCALLYAPQDVHLQRFFLDTTFPAREVIVEVARVAERVGDDPFLVEEAMPSKVNGREVESALRILEDAGGLGKVDFEQLRLRERHHRKLLEDMLGYVSGRACRRRMILDYFGATGAPRCNACDRCSPRGDAIVERRSGVAEPKAKRKRAAKKKPAAKKKATRTKATPASKLKPRSKAATKKAQAKAKAVAACLPSGDLLTRLKHLRTDLAKKRRTKPYRIFQNRTLEDLVEARPSSREALLEVYGLGPSKVSRYGDQLLEVIRQAGESEGEG